MIVSINVAVIESVADFVGCWIEGMHLFPLRCQQCALGYCCYSGFKTFHILKAKHKYLKLYYQYIRQTSKSTGKHCGKH